MCQGFGLIVSKELQVYFIEPDAIGDCSHSDILGRLGWEENTDIFIRNFVRVEYKDWHASSFRFDEDATLPGWAENNKDEIRTKCDRVLWRCAPAFAEYEKVCAPARAEFEKVCDAAWAEYNKVCDAAWAEFEKVCAPARAEYNKVCAPAFAEYEKVRDAAWAEYEKVRASARAEYAKVRASARAEEAKVCAPALAELFQSFSRVEGYVPERGA